MPTSEASAAKAPRDTWHAAVLVLIVLANLGLVAAGYRLRSAPLGADTTEPPFKSSHSINSAPILQNDRYLSWLFDQVRGRRGVLFVGTSESGPKHNLAAQLNVMDPHAPALVLLERMGLSPIHATFLFARCQREGIAPPPLVLVVNPVYFTRSHDVIDEGWLSSVMRSSTFVQMNHRNVAESLSPEVRAAYERHFRLRSALYPLVHQEYAGNLLYLSFHQAGEGVLADRTVPLERHTYDGEVPKYDEVRGILAGNTKVDALTPSRWEVSDPETSLNMHGLASTMAALRDARAPIALLVYPVNLTFYASYGMNRDTLRARYGALRERIARMRRPDRVYVLDLGDHEKLHFGFRDRMHNDAYGHHQLAQYLVENPEYRRFKDAVRSYYGL